MTRKTLARSLLTAAAVLAFCIAFIGSIGAASASTTLTPIYTNMPRPFPGNVPSQAFEATSTSEFGGQIHVTGNTGNTTRITVAMSSWACQSGTWQHSTGPEKCTTTPGATFRWPVTLKVYLPKEDGSVGPKIAQLTESFNMPYRPTANEECDEGEHEGGWGTSCYHGKLFKIGFGLKGVYLSGNEIVSVSYNTSNFGSVPQGPQPCNSEPQGCPYDSLNVGLTGTPRVGSDPLPADAYLNSMWEGAYCNGNEGTGAFRLDPGCWSGFQPDFEVTTG